MSDTIPRLAEARPTRSIIIPNSFQIEAVDKAAEASLGQDGRAAARKKRGIRQGRSILHPDQPEFPSGDDATNRPALAGEGQIPIALPSPPKQNETPPEVEFPNGAAPGDLGIGLEQFIGKFVGNGFNTILRPQNGPGHTNGTVAETLFEMNFTHETLEFLDWTVLRDVPNRGFDKQEDVNLRGIPYTQRISDLANSADGLPNLPLTGARKAPGIHFEQGLFMRTPALIPWKDFAPKEDFEDDFNKVPKIRGPQRIGPTISRMASIPHGTTINAQCLEPEKPIDGPPEFKNLSIKTVAPFVLKPDTAQLHEILLEQVVDFFPQARFETVEDDNRLPLQFKKFKDNNVINEQQFNNPENYLKDHNDKLGDSIISHIMFEVDTQPKLEPLPWGGGTDNIAQLAEIEVVQVDKDGVAIFDHKNVQKTTTIDPRETGNSSANANAAHVTCRYWVSTVVDTITIPAYDKYELPLLVPGLERNDDNVQWLYVSPPATAGVRKPFFQITLDKVDAPFEAKIAYTQIQYSQNVRLDFGALAWPHVSVATLVPETVTIASEDQFVRL